MQALPLPAVESLPIGGMDFLPNGDLALCTFAGEVWIVEGATGPVEKIAWRRFARGLNEPGGLKVVNGDIHVVQKCELTRLQDRDGDGAADWFECLSQDWGHDGNYHTFAYGPATDAAGNLFAFITGHRTVYENKFQGWAVKVAPDGTTTGFCSGLRCPNGFGTFRGDLFITDNQGHWVAANRLTHLQAGRFFGHPSARPAPRAQFDGDPNFAPPAVWFPYTWMRSSSDLVEITDDRFGPFQGQLLVGEFQNAAVFRVALEQVNGEWQGAVFPFLKGFSSGVNRLAFGPDGKLYVGGLRMGHWTSVAPRPFSLERVAFAGGNPFEIQSVHATRDGFELRFTRPVDRAPAGDARNYDAIQYHYEYDGRHRVPEKDRDEKVMSDIPVVVKSAHVSADGLRVAVAMDGLKTGHVILVRTYDLRSATGEKPAHDTFHYTLNRRP